MERFPIQLLVNADDAGVDHARNEGIIESFEKGIVRSATALVHGPAFQEIAAFAGSHPRFGLGLHFNLTEGSPASPGSPCLSPGGQFRHKHEFWAMAYAGELDPDEIALEFRAQVEKFLETGLTPTHFDGHNHVHVFLPVLQACLMALEGYPQLNKFRLPREVVSELPGPTPEDGVPSLPPAGLHGPVKALQAAGHPKPAFFRYLSELAASRIP